MFISKFLSKVRQPTFQNLSILSWVQLDKWGSYWKNSSLAIMATLPNFNPKGTQSTQYYCQSVATLFYLKSLCFFRILMDSTFSIILFVLYSKIWLYCSPGRRLPQYENLEFNKRRVSLKVTRRWLLCCTAKLPRLLLQW